MHVHVAFYINIAHVHVKLDLKQTANLHLLISMANVACVIPPILVGNAGV